MTLLVAVVERARQDAAGNVSFNGQIAQTTAHKIERDAREFLDWARRELAPLCRP